jgi:hypothetical protein
MGRWNTLSFGLKRPEDSKSQISLHATGIVKMKIEALSVFDFIGESRIESSSSFPGIKLNNVY